MAKLTSDDPRLTAYALGEMDEQTSRAFAAELAQHPELAEEVAAIRSMAVDLEAGFEAQPQLSLSQAQRAALAEEQSPGPVRKTLPVWFAPLAALLILAVAFGVLNNRKERVELAGKSEVEEAAENLPTKTEPPPTPIGQPIIPLPTPLESVPDESIAELSSSDSVVQKKTLPTQVLEIQPIEERGANGDSTVSSAAQSVAVVAPLQPVEEGPSREAQPTAVVSANEPVEVGGDLAAVGEVESLKVASVNGPVEETQSSESLAVASVQPLSVGSAPAEPQSQNANAQLAKEAPTYGSIEGTVTDTSAYPLPGVTVLAMGENLLGSRTAVTDANGTFRLVFLPLGPYELTATFTGFHTETQTVKLEDEGPEKMHLQMKINATVAEALVVTADMPVVDMSQETAVSADFFNKLPTGRSVDSIMQIAPGVSPTSVEEGYRVAGATGPENRQNASPVDGERYARKIGLSRFFKSEQPEENAAGESYAKIVENAFTATSDDARSTFSMDVDTAAYANVRRFLGHGTLPPVDAVRLEEMVNYFTYDDPEPTDQHPFAIHTAMAPAPWAPNHQLLRVGIKARSLFPENRPACNLVFLLDVSGSMSAPNKLPLVKKTMKLLADNMQVQDKVSIVVYAGASGVVLEPTSGNNKAAIEDALDNLKAGGSTNGAAGIDAAYALAEKHFVKGGVNRVILATDGDFNVGYRDHSALTRLIEHKRESGIFLTVLGFGMGNLQDHTLEELSNKGNGNAAYIDSLDEAYKVMTDEVGGTLFTVAKDVKMQVEFNPAKVKQWRLLGYENRLLNHQDFNDDRKDAGEVGAGHSLVVFYELIPQDGGEQTAKVDDLKYQEPAQLSEQAYSAEWLTLKMRYKQPDGDTSKLMEVGVTNRAPEREDDFYFAASVAAFAMKLRQSPHVDQFSYQDLLQMAQDHRGADPFGYREGFTDLVEKTIELEKEDP